MEIFDIAVIGEGITGLTAARRAAQKGARVATFESNIFGGLVINIAHLHDFPGAESGVDFASSLSSECSEAGVASHSDPVEALEVTGDTKVIRTASGERYGARAVILASGAALRKLGIPGEEDFAYRGVSQCADCDGPMFQGEEVVVAGGGDAAVQEATVLTGYVKHVHVIHRGTKFRARQPLVDELMAKPNVTVHWNTVAEAVLGADGVEQVRVRDTAAGATREIPCKGFFAFVGLEPATGYVPAAIGRDAAGAVVTNDGLETSARGVFAAGAVRSGYSGRLTDAIAEGERAADAAQARL